MRLKLTAPLRSRDGTLAKGAGMKNALAELHGDKVKLIKRPGIALTNEIITGGLAQGIADLNGLVYSVFDDTLLAFTLTAPETVIGGWNLRSASPILGGLLDYNNVETYNPGDFVIYPDEYGDDSVWFTVTTVSGIPPGHTPAAYPYWSRYRNLPAGTHPSVSYSIIQGTLHQEGLFQNPGYTAFSDSSLTVKVGNQTFGILPGSLFGQTVGPPPFHTATYTNYAVFIAGALTSGTISGPVSGPFVDATVDTPATETNLYIAARDYARSILA